VLRVCNTALEDYLRAVTIPCPYDVYGCRAYVAYCDADDHRGECPCAPCCCPEPGCPFSGSPRMLLAHIAGEHAAACPVPVACGRERRLMAQLAWRWHAVIGEEDGSLFLVSLVCLRANAGATAAAQYKCRLALELPGGGGGEDGRVAGRRAGARPWLPGGGAGARPRWPGGGGGSWPRRQGGGAGARPGGWADEQARGPGGRADEQWWWIHMKRTASC
jgi:hypothetical protein